MKANIKTAPIIGAALVLPFAILEWINTPGALPVALFVAMWILGASFVFLIMPILPARRAGETSMRIRSALPRALLAILVAYIWVSLTLDQLPCFLGVPNCD